MAWNDLLRALALVLVIEGILPFLNPATWRSAIQGLAALEDRTLRWIGFASMLAGLVLLGLSHGDRLVP